MKKFLFALMLLINGLCWAQYPDRAVRVIVPFGPGGGNDIIARIVSQELSTMWKVPVIVENKPGGDSLIGSEFVAKSTPDGYTLLANMVAAVSAAQAIRTDNQFNWETDLVTVGFMGWQPPFVIVTSSKNKITSLEELRKLGQTRGLTFGSAGVGGALYLYGEELARVLNVKGIHVPYKGTPPALLDVINNNTDFIVAPLGQANPHIVSGALTLLAIADDRPSPLFPGVPTVQSLGYSTFPTLYTTFNLIAPRGVPANIQKKIGEDVATAVKTLHNQLLERKLIDERRPLPALDQINAVNIRNGKQFYSLSKKYFEK
jgi:hypothetical protein